MIKRVISKNERNLIKRVKRGEEAFLKLLDILIKKGIINDKDFKE